METIFSIKRESWLSWFFRGLLILGISILVGRLIELQLIKGSYFRALAEENRVRRVPIAAPRGRIFGRGGEILVDNRQGQGEWIRDYKLGSSFAHVSGYVGEVGKEDVGKIDPNCPEKGPRKIRALIGLGGLEEQYNCRLSGIDGEELIEVDTMGREVRKLGKKEPTPGEDIKTNINFPLQIKVAQVMEGKKGAAVVTDANGEVLALYSAPSFDPNIFVGARFEDEIQKTLNDSDLPLFNRAIGGAFHPGSVFKPTVALAALGEGRIDENFIFDDPGVITIDKFSYSNWLFSQYGAKEGLIGLVRAIARSTDTFFYKIGEFLGPEKIAEWAKKLGYGQKLGIDIPGEIVGLVPDPEWKRKAKGEAWFLGNTYHYAIGQGDLAVTPLQVNVATEIIASGSICSPKIVGKPACRDLKIKDSHLKIVQEGMTAACSQSGTGLSFFDFTPQVACKTGTAETSLEGEPHAWFTLFAPSESPEIVITVLVEKGGEGSKVAGPLAREIADFWFHQKSD